MAAQGQGGVITIHKERTKMPGVSMGNPAVVAEAEQQAHLPYMVIVIHARPWEMPWWLRLSSRHTFLIW